MTSTRQPTSCDFPATTRTTTMVGEWGRDGVGAGRGTARSNSIVRRRGPYTHPPTHTHTHTHTTTYLRRRSSSSLSSELSIYATACSMRRRHVDGRVRTIRRQDTARRFSVFRAAAARRRPKLPWGPLCSPGPRRAVPRTDPDSGPPVKGDWLAGRGSIADGRSCRRPRSPLPRFQITVDRCATTRQIGTDAFREDAGVKAVRSAGRWHRDASVATVAVIRKLATKHWNKMELQNANQRWLWQNFVILSTDRKCFLRRAEKLVTLKQQLKFTIYVREIEIDKHTTVT